MMQQFCGTPAGLVLFLAMTAVMHLQPPPAKAFVLPSALGGVALKTKVMSMTLRGDVWAWGV